MRYFGDVYGTMSGERFTGLTEVSACSMRGAMKRVRHLGEDSRHWVGVIAVTGVTVESAGVWYSLRYYGRRLRARKPLFAPAAP